MLQQLTDFELIGLQGGYNLSDGHAYHDINESFPGFPSQLPEIWRDSEMTKVHIAEERFKTALAKLIGSETLEESCHYKISPTASNSIDLIAVYLATEAPRVLLVEPTFDNLALLLRRRGCTLQSIGDEHFRDPSAHLNSFPYSIHLTSTPCFWSTLIIQQERSSNLNIWC